MYLLDLIQEIGELGVLEISCTFFGGFVRRFKCGKNVITIKRRNFYQQFSEVYQCLGRLRHYICDESNSEQRSMETVYICSTNRFELLSVWCRNPLNSLNIVIILKTYY